MDFKFTPGQKVRFDREISGHVDRAILERCGTHIYNVCWINNGSFECREFYECEIECAQS